MKIDGRSIRFRKIGDGGKSEVAGIVGAFDLTEEHLHLIFKRKDLQTGDELRIEFEVLGDDDAG